MNDYWKNEKSDASADRLPVRVHALGVIDAALGLLFVAIGLVGFFGPLVGGIWLLTLGEWKLFLIGLLFGGGSALIVSILILPAMVPAAFGARNESSGKMLSSAILAIAAFLWIYLVAFVWTNFVMEFFAANVRIGQNDLPYLMFAVGIAVAPWATLSKHGERNMSAGEFPIVSAIMFCVVSASTLYIVSRIVFEIDHSLFDLEKFASLSMWTGLPFVAGYFVSVIALLSTIRRGSSRTFY